MGPTISASLLLLVLLTTTATLAAATVNPQELELMKSTLRSRGYTLFCNAISTSDLQLQFLSSSTATATTSSSSTTTNRTTSYSANFTDSGGTLESDFYTIFAPTDPYVYALDMASDAAAYVSTLRYHIIPNRRMMHSELRNLTTPFLETLLPRYSLLVNNNRSREQNGIVLGDLNSADMDVVWVDGVRISDPDVYVGSRIVVHGIDGILVTGIVKNEDLEHDERRLGLISGPPEAHVVSPVVTPAATDSPVTRAEANTGRSPVVVLAPGSVMTPVASAPGSVMTPVVAAPGSVMTPVAAAPGSVMTPVVAAPGSVMTPPTAAPYSSKTRVVAAEAGPGMSMVVGTGSGKSVGDRVKETRHKKHYHNYNHHQHRHQNRRIRGVRNLKRSSHNRNEDL